MRPQIFLIANFGAKLKILKFQIKNNGILKKLLTYLKSAPSNLSETSF